MLSVFCELPLSQMASLPFHCGGDPCGAQSAAPSPTSSISASPTLMGLKRERKEEDEEEVSRLGAGRPIFTEELLSILDDIKSHRVSRENVFHFPQQPRQKAAVQPPGHKAPFVPSTTFDPQSAGLSKEFILTDYTKLKGCSCKVPQPKLLELLHAIASAPAGSSVKSHGAESPVLRTNDANASNKNVGMDCSIVPLPTNCIDKTTGESLVLVSTTDFFFPSVEDPYLQGRIGAANVLSDMYSMGITDVDTMLMLLAASTDMDEGDKYQSTMLIMKGYADCCKEAGVLVTGGQTVQNPWPLIGGVAMACVPPSRMVHPSKANPPHFRTLSKGDILVLTKPLGSQVAVNVKQWVQRPSPIYQKCVEGFMSVDEIDALYTRAANGMARLNRNGARLMREFGAVACTDITGFGLVGHARNLVDSQTQSTENNLAIRFTTVPVAKGAIKASLLIGDKYKLFEGLSAETSGGLLVAFHNPGDAQGYIDAMLAAGDEAWSVGDVVEVTGDTNGGGYEGAFIDPKATWVDV